VKLGFVSTACKGSAQLNALAKEISEMLGRGHNADTLVSDIVLQAGLLIDGKLNVFLDRGTKSSVVLRSILVIGIILRIVNVILGAVATKTFGCNFEFLCAESKGHESKDPEKDTDGLARDILYGTDVDCLGWKRVRS